RDSVEVKAELADIEAAVAEWTREAEAEQAKLGVGNVSVYVPPITMPGRAPEDTLKGEPKVEVEGGGVDGLRALPAGNPALPTEEIDTRALREAGTRAQAPAAASRTAPGARTVGGNTERLRVVGSEEPKAASPWTKDAPASVQPDALPSSLRPGDVPSTA